MGLYFVSKPGGVIVPATLLEWGAWFEQGGLLPFEDGGRVVGLTRLPDGTVVSTVFLGLDHRLFGEEPPVLFETMIFPEPSAEPPAGEFRRRYAGVEDARRGHADAVRLACGEFPEIPGTAG